MSDLASTDLMIPEHVVMPVTGEAFDLAIPQDAATAIRRLRELENELARQRRYAELALAMESQRQGTRTLHLDGVTARISGGPGATGIDPVILRQELIDAECPEERIDAAIKQTVEEKVDRSVCRQLATNPAYKAAIDRATFVFEKTYSVKVD